MSCLPLGGGKGEPFLSPHRSQNPLLRLGHTRLAHSRGIRHGRTAVEEPVAAPGSGRELGPGWLGSKRSSASCSLCAAGSRAASLGRTRSTVTAASEAAVLTAPVRTAGTHARATQGLRAPSQQPWFRSIGPRAFHGPSTTGKLRQRGGPAAAGLSQKETSGRPRTAPSASCSRCSFSGLHFPLMNRFNKET